VLLPQNFNALFFQLSVRKLSYASGWEIKYLSSFIYDEYVFLFWPLGVGEQCARYIGGGISAGQAGYESGQFMSWYAAIILFDHLGSISQVGYDVFSFQQGEV